MSPEKEAVSPDDMHRYLHGLDFPADRDRLIRKARESGASPEVLKMLATMPAQDYGSMAEVMRRYAER